MIAAATAGAVLVVTTLGWIRYSASRWKSQLLKFRKDHHGYTTALGNEVDSLLIVCPASGGGLAMRGYDECLNALEQRGLKVEVYVTQSTDDVIHLTTTKHFERYSKMIAVLSGDSSVYEMIQASVDKTNGKWPYAPILVVPGGSSNVLSCEFHGFKTRISEVVQRATAVRQGSVIRVTSPGATPRYSLHVAFDGIQRRMVEEAEKYRSTLYAAFGQVALVTACFKAMISIPFCKKPLPFMLSVFNSDIEGGGINLNFGVNRFDDKMIIIYKSQYASLLHMLRTMTS